MHPISRNASTAFLQNVTLIRRALRFRSGQACAGALAGLTVVLAGCSGDRGSVAADQPWRVLNQRVNDVLYMVGESSVWSIQTRVRGFRHPGAMN